MDLFGVDVDLDATLDVATVLYLIYLFHFKNQKLCVTEKENQTEPSLEEKSSNLD